VDCVCWRSLTLHKNTNHPTRFSVDGFVQSGLRATVGVAPNGVSLPTYGVVNLSAVQKLDTGVGNGTELRLDVLNVGDTIYEIRNGTGVGVGAPQFGLRRTILAGVTQRFSARFASAAKIAFRPPGRRRNMLAIQFGQRG